MASLEGIGIDVKALAGPLVDLGMGLAGTARVDVVLHLEGTNVYDPATGRNVESGGQDVSFKALLYQELEAEVPDTCTLMVNPSDIPAGVRAPRNADQITVGADRWIVNTRTPIPGDAVYLLQLRK
jgi:hypothetical protein